MAQTVNAPNVVGSDQMPLTTAYDSASGNNYPLAGGVAQTDASHSSQKALPLQVQGTLAGNAAPAAALASMPVSISPNNSGLPVNVPQIVQKAAAVSTGSVASLTATFASPNTKGNSIVVVTGIGNGTAPTLADSLSNTYAQAVTSPNSTTFEAAIWFATNIAGGANTVTVTNAGSAASMAVEIYEVSGLLTVAAAQPDYTSLSNGTSASPSAPNHSPSCPNSIAFLGVAVGTAAQAVTAVAGSGWTLDSSQNTTTPAGLYTFGSLSAFLASTAAITPKATLAGSEPYALAAAVFRPVALPIAGIITQDGYNYSHYNSAQTNTVVKTGPGILHAILLNTAVASATFEFDDAITHTNAIGIVTLPGTILQTSMYFEYDVRFNTGLAITSTGTADWTVVWK